MLRNTGAIEAGVAVDQVQVYAQPRTREGHRPVIERVHAATSALVARYLARDNSRSMALIGNGSQSEFQALASRVPVRYTAISFSFKSLREILRRDCRMHAVGLHQIGMTAYALKEKRHQRKLLFFSQIAVHLGKRSTHIGQAEGNQYTPESNRHWNFLLEFHHEHADQHQPTGEKVLVHEA